VIAVYGTAPTLAVMAATKTIPIVAISVGDPVRAGLVESLARPGGNLTGNTVLGPDIGAKRTQLLKELIPTVARVAFLWNPDNASHLAYLEELRAAAPALGVQMVFVRAGSSDSLDNVLAAMMQEHPDAFTMTGDPFHQLHLPWIIDFLARHRLPAMYQLRENVLAGGLVSYGASQPDLFRRAAGYVQRILQGTKPADLPVEQPVKFDLVVNLRTARALGLTVPESFLLRADEVVE
jgi:putative ABC transport system substrate-binding protein